MKTAVALLLGLSFSSLSISIGAPRAINIGTTTQLLFDDFIVESLSGGRRATETLHPTVVVQPDAPVSCRACSSVCSAEMIMFALRCFSLRHAGTCTDRPTNRPTD